MIINLSGQDTFRSRERLKQLREAFVKKYDPSGMNVARLDGMGLKFEAFQESVASQGFLSSRRLVIVERPFEADRKTQEAMAQYIKDKSVPEQTIVVFWSGEEQVKKRKKESEEPSRLHALLNRSQQREVFDFLEPLEVEGWIARRVKERGGTIERAAAERLASAVGSDLWLAANEIDKLLHQHGGTIAAKDIDDSISAKVEESIFAFTDALSRKDARQALRLLEEQLEGGTNELYLLTMIGRQIRILLGISDVAASEPNPATIASRLKLHPFVVKKGLQQIRFFSQSELIQAHDQLVTIDRKLKSTRVNPRALLELFVLRLCSG